MCIPSRISGVCFDKHTVRTSHSPTANVLDWLCSPTERTTWFRTRLATPVERRHQPRRLNLECIGWPCDHACAPPLPPPFVVPLSYRSAYIGEHGAKRVNGNESIVRSSVFDMLAPNRRSKVPIKRQFVPRNSKTPADSTRFREQCETNSDRVRAFQRALAGSHVAITSSEASITWSKLARGLARDNDVLQIRRPKSSYSVYVGGIGSSVD